jgi:hypothetical protein
VQIPGDGPAVGYEDGPRYKKEIRRLRTEIQISHNIELTGINPMISDITFGWNCSWL